MLLSQLPLTFHQIQKWMPISLHSLFCSRADWDSLGDHLKDVSLGDIFKLGVSTAASGFCEWIQVGIDVYILH